MATEPITAYRCTCDICAHRWTAIEIPTRCANRRCGSRAWNRSSDCDAPGEIEAQPGLPEAEWSEAQAFARAGIPANLLALAERKITEQCPHGWANWLQCPDCRSRD